MKRLIIGGLTLVAMFFFALNVEAGGSGFNVAIIVNQNSTNSVQLGNYYRQMRNVPPQNLLRINWTGTNTEWSLTDYTTTLLNPFLAMLASRQLTNQIDYIVLSMDIPYIVSNGTNGVNSTTSTLFYGFKNDPGQFGSDCEITDSSTNLYAASESIFRSTPPISASSNSWLATMITANTLATAEMVVAQGASSDGTFPTQTVWLGKSTDTSRNTRFTEFDNTVFNTRLRGNYSVQRTNDNNAIFNGLVLGFQNGLADFSISPTPLFVPGAMADCLTSFGGEIFQDTGQTTLLAFLGAGASGSYGTVTEPCNYLNKFPDAQNYFYQSRGFSLGECYYQSLTNTYEGLVCGEPLAAPFAQTASGAWSGLGSNALISGTTNLVVQFNASDALHPLQQLDLFLDGTWLQTVTNIAPQSGNVLNVKLNGFATSYTVPAGATIKSVTSNLVNTLNGIVYQNETKVLAVDHGDRIELQSTAAYTKTGAQISLSAGSTNSSGALTTFLYTSNTNPTNFLDSVAQGIEPFIVEGTLLSGATLSLSVTKTNNAAVTVVVTNNGAATVSDLVQQLITAVDNSASLQGLDGLTAGDLQEDSNGNGYFNLLANGQGYAAAQIKASLTASVGLEVSPTGSTTLTANVNDLRPRNHLYITAGVTNLAATVPLNTTILADGYHELTAVVYEGSHVHTQTRATQSVIVRNNSLTATLTPILSGTNTSLEPLLEIAVTANAGNIASIQLFSTGGLLASTTNQSSAIFPITLSNLDIGLHPFYAIVTDNSGHQYRTQTQCIGLVGVSYAGANLLGVDYSIPVQVTGPAPVLTFPATAGRAYNILSTTNLSNPFQLVATVTPTNSVGQYAETNTAPAQQFYRISAAP
jgi:uncharacterized protein (TIGR03790 family)